MKPHAVGPELKADEVREGMSVVLGRALAPYSLAEVGPRQVFPFRATRGFWNGNILVILAEGKDGKFWDEVGQVHVYGLAKPAQAGRERR